jgi:hypothetical protein
MTHRPCHERKASAIDSIGSVKRNAAGAEIDDQTDKSTTVPLDACIGLAVPGRPIGPWSWRTGAPKASVPRRDRRTIAPVMIHVWSTLHPSQAVSS